MKKTSILVVLVCVAFGLIGSGGSTGAQSATCFGETPTIVAVAGQITVGTRGADVILGTPGNDTIRGGGGADKICGLGGHDSINGGRGADMISGGSGSDVIHGGQGDDTVTGGRGRDTLVGEGGDDTLAGQGSADIVLGNKGDDSVDGGLGNDECYGGEGVNTVSDCEVPLAPTAVLTVDYDVPSEQTGSYTLTCFEDGTGQITDGAVTGVSANAACASLDDSTVLTRLVDGPPEFEVCVDVESGPETATINGFIDGAQVTNQTFARNNGCRTDEWDGFMSDLLPPPA